MNELVGIRVLVTEGARGIGAVIALSLAEKGADVAVTYRHSAGRAAKLIHKIRAGGQNGVAIQADSADPAAIRRSVDEATLALGGLDVVFSDAGTTGYRMTAGLPTDLIDTLLSINARAPIAAEQTAIARQTRRGGMFTD